MPVSLDLSRATPCPRVPRRICRKHLDRPASYWLAGCAIAVVSTASSAQQAGDSPSEQRRPFSIAPYASITETLTDNANLTTQKKSDLITQPSVGVRALSDSAWLKGYVDYSVTGLGYARESGASELQQALDGYATVQVVPSHAAVDLAGVISQQSISPFGVQSTDTSLNNSNRTAVSSFSVSPYLHGRLAGAADYEVRLRYVDTRSDGSIAANNTLSSESVSLGDSSVARKINWSAQLNRTVIDYHQGERTEDDLLRGVLSWNVTSDLALSAIGGEEANNYVSVDKESHAIWGAGIRWVPSRRTNFSAEVERRFFGNSHSVVFTHRTARTVVSFVDTRDVSTNNSTAFGNRGTAYDLFFQQFASIEPDPIVRQQLVNNFLLANGIDPNATAIARFLNSAVTLQSVRSLSFAWLGRRDTFSLSASQTRQQQLSVLSGAGGSLSNAMQVNQKGLLATISHRLTPRSSIALFANRQHTTGLLSSDTSDLTSLGALFTIAVGRHSDVSVGARRALFSNVTTPYNETAVFGTFRAQF